MSEMVKVVVDAMGGDNAPVEPVKAAVEAVKEKQNIQVILTGQEDVIKAELQKYPDYPKDRIRVVHTSQVIETAEPPVMAIQKKKDSSIVVGLNLVKKQEADAFVSSGNISSHNFRVAICSLCSNLRMIIYSFLPMCEQHPPHIPQSEETSVLL